MNQKIVFISKSLCYHQIHLADELFSIYGERFSFIQVREPLPFRVENEQEGFQRPYLLGLAKDEFSRQKAIATLKTATIVIQGEAAWKYIKYCPKDCLILRYSERIYKKGYYKTSFIQSLKVFAYYWLLRLHLIGRKSYLLSASGYAPNDYAKFCLYRHKSYKWGYFPRFIDYHIDELMAKKSNVKPTILWVSRLINWKHPEHAVMLAKFLRDKQIDFQLKIIGDGDETSGEAKSSISSMIENLDLTSSVHMLGKLKPKEVIEEYERCDIAIFTSGYAEGWGVGVNEAMNAATAIVASSAMGSVPYLIEDGYNGFIYDYPDVAQLCEKVKGLCLDSELRRRVSVNAFTTLKTYWAPQVAAKRLAQLIDTLLKNETPHFAVGPCSIAHPIKGHLSCSTNRTGYLEKENDNGR